MTRSASASRPGSTRADSPKEGTDASSSIPGLPSKKGEREVRAALRKAGSCRLLGCVTIRKSQAIQKKRTMRKKERKKKRKRRKNTNMSSTMWRQGWSFNWTGNLGKILGVKQCYATDGNQFQIILMVVRTCIWLI